jgi:hypothetical protein
MLEALALGVELAHPILKLLHRAPLVPEEPLIGGFEVVGRGGGQPVHHCPAGEAQRPHCPLDAALLKSLDDVVEGWMLHVSVLLLVRLTLNRSAVGV